MKLRALMAQLDCTYRGCGPEDDVGEVLTDSRRAAAGDLFIAVRGSARDGHDFVPGVHNAGGIALVERGVELGSVGPVVEVADIARALPVVAGNRWGWPGRQLRLAGITGTNGKTTTAHLLAAILDAAGRPHARLGTTGNWLVDRHAPTGFTTPFPLELQGLLATAVHAGATDAVMEVSSHALDQARIDPLRYDAIALTSFSQDHLDYHPSMDAYFQAKLRLAQDYVRPGGVAVAPVDDLPQARAFLAAARKAGASALRASRGPDGDAEIRAREVTIDVDGTRAQIETPSGPFRLESPLVGTYNLDNAMVATGLALGMGLPIDAIARGLARGRAPGRLEPVTIEGVAGPAVYIDYAHTPDAVARALAALRPSTRGRLVVVLGCGGDRDRAKRPRMAQAAVSGADWLYATSDNPRTEDPERILDDMLAELGPGTHDRDADRARTIARAVADAADQDVVLVAGKGHEDYQVLGTTKIHFDDREHAEAALRARLSRA